MRIVGDCAPSHSASLTRILEKHRRGPRPSASLKEMGMVRSVIDDARVLQAPHVRVPLAFPSRLTSSLGSKTPKVSRVCRGGPVLVDPAVAGEFGSVDSGTSRPRSAVLSLEFGGQGRRPSDCR